MKKLCLAGLCAIMTTSVLVGCSTQTTETEGTTTSETTVSKSEETSSGTDMPTSEPITFYGVMDPQISAQQIVADKMGYFVEEGLTIENLYVQSGTDISPLIASGDAPVSVETTYTDIPLAAAGIGVKVLAPLCNIGDTQCVVASAEANIKSSKDIEGKRIGMATGSGVLMAIQEMCEVTGVDFNSLEFVNLAPSDQISAMEAGDIDMMACWQPWVNTAVDAGGNILFSGMNSYLTDYEKSVNWLNFYSTLQVTDSFLEERPEDAEAILRAMNKATDYINSNMEEAATLIAEELQLETSEVLGIMEMNTYDMTYSQAFVDASNTMAEFLLSQDNIPEAPSIESYTNPEPLRKAVPELVTVE